MHNVDIRLQAPRRIPNGWAWGEIPRYAGVLASESVHSESEAVAVARAYAVTMSRLLRPRDAERFVILLRSAGGQVMCRDEWRYVEGAFRPTGAPWSVWISDVGAHALLGPNGTLIA